MTPASIVAAISSRKGIVLLASAVLLVFATLAIGRNQSTVAQTPKTEQPAAASAPQKTPAAEAQLSGAQRKEIEAIVREYLTENPEILMEMTAALNLKRDKIEADRMAAAIKKNAREVFRPASSPVVGNSKGDVTVVEFFDYNCTFCKRVVGDVVGLVEQDKKVKFILKELPVLGPGSEEAARVALAARMQGKYWEFHRAMLESKGQASEASALRMADKLGLDVARLKKDMVSEEVKKEIEETRALANKLGIEGTPYFLIADRVIPGYAENLLERMSKLVAEVRKEGCKVC
jgi:protein-disulfide isomerase